MSWLSDMPFQRKLRFAIVLTTAVAIVLACGVFLVFEFIGFRRNLERTVQTLSRVTADNSTAAVAFGDPARARKTLESLRAEPQIIAAALVSTQGQVVASYQAEGMPAPPEIPNFKAGIYRSSGRVVAVQPVIEGSRWLGTLYLWASMDQLYHRMWTYSLVVLGVLGVTLSFAWVLSSILRRTIARPILELANTTGAVARGQDFSLRAKQYGTDELGRLTEAFNAMLERTQSAVVALRESEAQLRVVTDNAPVFLTQCDRDYRFTFVNRPNALRFDLEPEQMVGRHIADVLGAAVFEKIRPHIDAALAGRRVELEQEVPYENLGMRWMQTIYVPDRRPDGTIAGFVGMVSDVTQRRESEQQVARARDEALAASHAKDEFLAALSHELRTPLNPVLLIASEAAQDDRLPPEVREDFETIRKNVELEARLIDDLLDLTAITRGKLSLDRKHVNVHAVLRDAMGTVATGIDEKNISLVLQAETTDAATVGDPVRLQQVFWNVLKNAVKFTPEGGRIEVETAVRGDRVMVRVTDTGIGLTPAELDRIFDAFSQGDHAVEGGSHQFGGLGLGLAISRMVIELHGGTIVAESPGRGRGASFRIELPLAVTDERVEPPAPAPKLEKAMDASEGAGADNGNHRRRILLVEDHDATRAALERLLLKRGFTVVPAASLTEAHSRAAAESFDLLVSDVGLPDGSGYDLMAKVAAEYGLKGIALTGYGMPQDLDRSVNAGFCAHLTKPVRVEALDEALATIFES